LTRQYGFFLILTVAITGCTPAPPKSVRIPTAPTAPPSVSSSLPKSPATVVAADISTQLPPSQPAPPDEVGNVIKEARSHFDKGTELYDTGYLKQARIEFDSAVDTLLSSSRSYPGNERIRNELNTLVARINEMEMAAIRNGDGFTDQDGQHAAIDDLDLVPTFPAPIDPKQREAVEAGVRAVKHDLPIELNGRVLTAVDYFQNGRGRNSMSVGLERIGVYRPMVERILKEEGVPLDLIYLAQAESAFVPRAISRAKARGMWQFISSRGKEYGLRQTWWIDERSDPEKSTRAAARHLNDLFMEFNDWYLAMAAYNAGPLRIEQALKRTGSTTFWELADKRALPKETINYVPTIVALAIIGRDPGQYGFNVEPDPPLDIERVSLEKATDLRVIAENLGVPLDLLKDLNPHVLRWTTPPDDPDFELILPKGYSDKFTEKVVTLPENERILWRYHDVKKGETLSIIARSFGVSVNDLTQANKISAKSPLRVGQELLIPMSGATRAPAPAAATSTTSAPRVAANAPARTQTASPTVYKVRQGDTLSAIAAKFNVSINDLKKWNKLTSTRLDIGQKLSLAPVAARQAN
jgi:membrane-bound lytic murein transglycosylase D